MKRTIFSISWAILFMLLLFPPVLPAKSAQSTFYPLGTSDIAHTYNNIPFQVWGSAGLYVQKNPDDSDNDADSDTYEVNGYNANKVHFIQGSIWSADLVDGTPVGKINACYEDTTCDSVDLIIGVNTAEWAYDCPGVQVQHTKIPPAYSDTFEGCPDMAHYFYTSVDTDPAKNLTSIELTFDSSTSDDRDQLGITIIAITVETPEVPPRVIGLGLAPCEDDTKKCIFGFTAMWRENEAWPTGYVFFMDFNAGLVFQANDIRRFAPNSFSVPGTTFLTGWGRLNGEDCRFSLWIDDNGYPGAGNDIFRIRILEPWLDNLLIYGTELQPIIRGNIIINTQ